MSESILDDLDEAARLLVTKLYRHGFRQKTQHIATIDVPNEVIMACHQDSRLKINTRPTSPGEWLSGELIVNIGHASVLFRGVAAGQSPSNHSPVSWHVNTSASGIKKR